MYRCSSPLEPNGSRTMDSAARAGDALLKQPMNSRNKIRQQLRQQRRMLSLTERKQAARKLCARLTNSPLFLRSQRVACYLANDGEMDLQPVMSRIWWMKKECYLPVIRRLNHNRLGFVHYVETEKLVQNRYNIPEPKNPNQQTPPWALNLLLLPLVAFDSNGNRLGMGGGYYDRTLAFLRRREQWHTPRLIGVAYDFQRVENLASEPWDIPLDGVVTESKIILFGR